MSVPRTEARGYIKGIGKILGLKPGILSIFGPDMVLNPDTSGGG